MLPYFRSYTIAICAIAVALPLVTSTLWPVFTGQMMMSTIGGLVLAFVLFFAGMFIGYAIFNRLADSKVQAMLSAYNDDCDPSALVSDGAKIVSQVSYPCNQATSWFMGYYGQALLDSGEAQAAKGILGGLRLSIDSAKKPGDKAGILVNFLPLDEKMEGQGSALSVVEEGLAYCKEFSGAYSEQYADFLESQKTILDALVSNDVSKAVKMCESIRENPAYPMRLRVEYAWIEASKLYGHADKPKEIDCLKFVEENGNKLALVGKAKARLSEI